MISPLITNLADGVRFTFKEHLISVTTQRIRTNGDGVITGEVDIETNAPAISPELYYGKFNFLSLETRQRLAGYLKSKYETPPWTDILEAVCRNTVTTTRRGDKFIEISSANPPPAVEFDVFPLLQTNQPTTIYGDGGTGKSWIAMVLAIATRIGWYDI